MKELAIGDSVITLDGDSEFGVIQTICNNESEFWIKPCKKSMKPFNVKKNQVRKTDVQYERFTESTKTTQKTFMTNTRLVPDEDVLLICKKLVLASAIHEESYNYHDGEYEIPITTAISMLFPEKLYTNPFFRVIRIIMNSNNDLMDLCKEVIYGSGTHADSRFKILCDDCIAYAKYNNGAIKTAILREQTIIDNELKVNLDASETSEFEKPQVTPC